MRSEAYSKRPTGALGATKDHVSYCFDVLSAHFSGCSAPEAHFENVYWYVTRSSQPFARSCCSNAWAEGIRSRTTHLCVLGFTQPAVLVKPSRIPWANLEEANTHLCAAGCSPLFVTWNKASRRGSRLRGCIGTLEPRYLHTALKDYALTRCVIATAHPMRAMSACQDFTCHT